MRIKRRAVLSGALGLSTLAPAPAIADDNDSLERSCRALVDRYGAKDLVALEGMFDPGGVIMVGADIAEHAEGPAAVRALIEADYALWETSVFAPFDWIHVAREGRRASALFQTRWTRHSGPRSMSFMLRFATNWRRVRRSWRLSWCLNQVASEGMSAAEILRRASN